MISIKKIIFFFRVGGGGIERTILHCDCNSFYASVECIFHPKLKTVPMAVGGSEKNRHGIILAKNELAKKYHVKTAEPIWQAKRKCPDLIVVPPHRKEYFKYSNLIREIYQEYTDQVEPFGLDEAWLDVTASQSLFGDGKQIADALRNRIREELGLTISVGVSFNKIFAKLGSDYKKPDATTIIDKKNFQEVVYPLPTSALLFVGKNAEKTLKTLGIRTIGQLAEFPVDILESKLGKTGKLLHTYARGEDESLVKTIYDGKEIKSIGNSITFCRNLITEEDIQKGVEALSDKVASRLRKQHVKCWTVQILIKDAQFHLISRQRPLTSPTNLAKDLEESVYDMICKHWIIGNPIRMLSIQCSHLIPESKAICQLSLSSKQDDNQIRQEKLEKAMDMIRDRFGKNAVMKANLMQDDIGCGRENAIEEDMQDKF